MIIRYMLNLPKRVFIYDEGIGLRAARKAKLAIVDVGEPIYKSGYNWQTQSIRR